jgi:hypothetical protein
MRKFVSLALLLAFVVSASAAEAASRVFVIHGIPGVPVDVYASLAGAPIPSTPTIPGFQPKAIVSVPTGGASPSTFASTHRARIRRRPSR